MVVSAAKTLVTADELPALSARFSALGRRTELVGGHLAGACAHGPTEPDAT